MTYMKGKWLWLGMATPLLILVLLCAACGSEDGPLSTRSSSFQANPDSSSALQLGRVSGLSDDNSSDDNSDDNNSDDNSSDDNSSDDDGLEDARVRGLLFDLGDCETVTAPPCTLTIKATPVQITENTRLDIEPKNMERVMFDTFVASLTESGLPMRARGSDSSGMFVTTRVRIDDELKASGSIVSGPDAAGVFALQVNDDTSAPLIYFMLSLPGLQVPMGDIVRIEANVPSDFDLTSPVVYEVFDIEDVN